MPTMIKGNAMIAKMANQPLLLSPGSEDIFTQNLVHMAESPKFEAAVETTEKMQADEFWDDDDEFISWLRPYNVKNGVLTIPVHGVLMNKFSMKFGNFATGYQYIERAFERGMDDDDVDMIAFDIDSPGGEVAGNFELVEKIVAERGAKPMRAFANDHAYSAAYSIATASDSITMARSGGVGSVGVITMHIDQSARLDSMGIKVTFIYAGEHKKDGNPYEALPDSVKDRIQDRIDRIYGEFVGLVANNRGMEEQAVRDTEALTFDASNAVEVGFADRIGDMQKELAALSLAATEMEQMSTKATTTPAAGNEGSNITQAQLDDAVATARADGHAEGMSAERTRITGILNSEEAKTRPAAARMAVNAGMSVEAAAESLKDMPEEKPQAAAPAETAPKGTEATAPAPTPFASNMDGPDVGAHVTDPADDADASVDLLGSYAMITGRDPRQKAN